MISGKFLKISHRLLGTAGLGLILLLGGCHLHPGSGPKDTPPLQEIKRLVVVGFLPALAPEEQPGVTRSPLSGTVFMAEPVTQDVADLLTDRLFLGLLKAEQYDLISPGQAKGAFSQILSSKPAPGDMEMIKKIGRTFSAQAVLAGHAYRWKERQGTDYAADSPASVAFDLYLIRAQDGRILWRGKFDKTQQALSENLLDMGTFITSKGTWMKARSLAHHGLDGLLEDLTRRDMQRKDENL